MGKQNDPLDDVADGLNDNALASGAEMTLVADHPATTAAIRTPLSSIIGDSAASNGHNLKDLTVLAARRDPFRFDTAANHRDGQWLADMLAAAGVGQIHLRGLHYACLGLEAVKPNGKPYVNTEEDWLWLSESAAKAARWLGYIPFNRIDDHRNTAPTVRLHSRPDPKGWLRVGVDVAIPDAADLAPRAVAVGFTGVQPFRLVIVGEKSSLDDVLAPVASAREADLYLPSGEISDTLIFKMAADTATDGRPLVVLYFSDCDPAGWQMPISVARKLQAVRGGWFPDIEFEVHRVALTPGQVREYGLPSAPMKAGERRRDAWLEATGVEQSEIDALATLRPELLRSIAYNAIAPYWDTTLAGRVAAAERDWVARAQAAVDGALDQDRLAAIRADAEVKLDEMRDEIAAMNDAFRVDLDDIPGVPDIVVPEPNPGGPYPLPLCSSGWSFTEQSRRLIASKTYGDVR